MKLHYIFYDFSQTTIVTKNFALPKLVEQNRSYDHFTGRAEFQNSKTVNFVDMVYTLKDKKFNVEKIKKIVAHKVVKTTCTYNLSPTEKLSCIPVERTLYTSFSLCVSNGRTKQMYPACRVKKNCIEKFCTSLSGLNDIYENKYNQIS